MRAAVTPAASAVLRSPRASAATGAVTAPTSPDAVSARVATAETAAAAERDGGDPPVEHGDPADRRAEAAAAAEPELHRRDVAGGDGDQSRVAGGASRRRKGDADGDCSLGDVGREGRDRRCHPEPAADVAGAGGAGCMRPGGPRR